MKKRIYIAGGGGMLGEAFYTEYSKDHEVRVTDIDLNEPWIKYLDFRDYKTYREDVTLYNPDFLFHIGALTDLEFCELQSEHAYLTNTKAVEHAVSISNELGIPLLYISTAGIFDGNKKSYDETDEPRPLGHYANSKYLGEKYVLANKENCLVCRAGWMMGGGPAKDKKFIGKILGQIRQGRKTLNIVNDKFGTPSYTHDFANNVKILFQENRSGLYNVACKGETSRVEIAKEIVRSLGRENEVSISEVDSDFFRNEYFAVRPESERLVNARLERDGLDAMRDWKTCLNEYLNEYYHEYFL